MSETLETWTFRVVGFVVGVAIVLMVSALIRYVVLQGSFADGANVACAAHGGVVEVDGRSRTAVCGDGSAQEVPYK